MRLLLSHLFLLLIAGLSAQDQFEVIIAEAGGPGVVSQVAYSGDGRFVAINRNGIVLLCDVRSGKIVRSLPTEFANIKVLVMSRDSRFAACIGDGKGSGNSELGQIWNLETSWTEVFKVQDGKPASTLAFSPDSKYLASGGRTEDIIVFQVLPDKAPKEAFVLGKNQGGHRQEVRALAFSADGGFLVSGAEDNTVKVWSMAGQSLVKTLEGQEGDVFSIDISRGGEYLLSGGRDNLVRLWNLKTDEVKTLDGHTRNIFQVRFSPDGKTIFSSAEDLTLKGWDLKGELLFTHEVIPPELSLPGMQEKQLYAYFRNTSFDISPDGKYLAYASFGRNMLGYFELGSLFSSFGEIVQESVSIFDIQRRQVLRRLPKLASNPVTGLFFSANSQKLCSYAENRFVQVFDLAQVNQDLAFGIPDTSVRSMILSPDWQYVLYRRGRSYLDFEPEYELSRFPDPSDQGFSFDNRQTIGTFKAASDGNPFFFEYWTPSISFSPDSKYLARIQYEKGACILVILELGPEGQPRQVASIPVGKIEYTENAVTTPLAYSQQGAYLSVGMPGRVLLFETANWERPPRVLSLPSNAVDACLSLQFIDGDQVLSVVYWAEDASMRTKFQERGYFRLKNSKPEEKETGKKLGGRLLKALDSASGKEEGDVFFGKEIVVTTMEVISRIMGVESLLRQYSVQAFAHDGTFRIQTKKEALDFKALAGLQAGLLGGVEAGRKVTGGLPSGSVKGRSFVRAMAISPDDRFIALGEDNGSIEIISRANGNRLVTLAMASREYLFLSPDNYYATARDGGGLVTIRVGKDYYPFDVMDVKYNRPDLVWKHLSDPQNGIVGRDEENTRKFEAIEHAYRKRLQKMGLEEFSLSVDVSTLPAVSILNIDQLPVETTERTLELSLELKSPKLALSRLHVFVNDVPVFGTQGMDLSAENARSVQRKIPLTLSYGKNVIQIYTENAAGLRSFRETVPDILLKGDRPPVDLYLIAIGAAEYRDNTMNLRFAGKDAEGVVQLFTSQKGKYRQVKVYQLLNQEVTREKILSLREVIKGSGVDDQVILYYAGHGLYDADFNYYLATWDLDFSNPAARGLSYEQMAGLLDGIPARDKLLLLDACHSGEIDAENVVRVEKVLEKDEEITFRAVGDSQLAEKGVGLENSFELMNQLFADLREGTGAAVIAAAGGMEYAREGGNIQNGVFTFALLEGLADNRADADANGRISISELKTYLDQRVRELTKNQQRPTSRSRKFSNDWSVW